MKANYTLRGNLIHQGAPNPPWLHHCEQKEKYELKVNVSLRGNLIHDSIRRNEDLYVKIFKEKEFLS